MKLTAQNEEPIEWVSTHQLIKPNLVCLAHPPTNLKWKKRMMCMV